MAFKYVILDLSLLPYDITVPRSCPANVGIHLAMALRLNHHKINHGPSDVAFENTILSLDDPSV